MIKYLLLLFIMAIFFCSFFGNKISKESKIVHQIVRQISEKYERKYKLNFSGISLSAPGGIYRKIGISFEYYGYLSKDDARKILVESATDLIEKINANDELKPYLKNYPFTGDNVTITIFLRLPNGQRIYYPDMKITKFHRNKVCFVYDTPETEKAKGYYFLEEKETLEETRQILEQKQKLQDD